MDPEEQTAPVFQTQASSASGEITFTSDEANLTVNTKVQDGDGEPVQGVMVQMVAGTNSIALSTYDPTGKYMPTIEVIPRAAASSLKSGSQHVRVEAWLVLSEAGAGMAGVSFYRKPPIFDMNGLEPGLVSETTQVSVAAERVVPMGGVITIKCQVANGDYKLINLYFGKDWTVPGVIEKLGEFLDTTKDHRISTHEMFPRYAEITAGKTGELYDTEPGIEYEIVAHGEDYHNYVADITVTNDTALDYRLIIIPGTTLENSNTDHQDLTVIDTTVVIVPPGETVEAEVYGACVHRHKAGPEDGDILTPFRDQRPDLVQLCIFIDYAGMDIPDDVWQQGIWVITDEHAPDPENLAGVRALFTGAGLDPDAYPALNDPHNEGGGTSFSSIHPSKK